MAHLTLYTPSDMDLRRRVPNIETAIPDIKDGMVATGYQTDSSLSGTTSLKDSAKNPSSRTAHQRFVLPDPVAFR